ncbi:MAG: type II secretion system F family protein [Phycisphaerae bacterium]|nr:type II secretion system F family protein [Phycisphaerae bacterium]
MTELLGSLLPIKSELSAGWLHSSKVKQSELLLFTSQLSVMLSSGVILSEAVEAIAARTKDGVFQSILFDISDSLQNGESLSVSLSAFPKVFTPMFIGIVEASEASGRMSEMLDVLQKYIESEVETKRQIKGALVYPIIMMVMAVIATTTFLFFVLPKFTKIYESRGRALPVLTQLLVNFSKLLSDFWSASLILAVMAVFGGAVFYALSTPGGRKMLDYLKIHTPVLGTMFIDAIMTRSARIMATMLGSGVTLLDTLHIVQNACDNEYFYRFWSETCDRVEAGFQLSEAMSLASYSGLIPPAVLQMIRAGEKGGTLGPVCEKISDFYDKKLKNSIKVVTTTIEPLMIIIMGCIVGTIAIALLLPIFRISTLLSH